MTLTEYKSMVEQSLTCHVKSAVKRKKIIDRNDKLLDDWERIGMSVPEAACRIASR